VLAGPIVRMRQIKTDVSDDESLHATYYGSTANGPSALAGRSSPRTSLGTTDVPSANCVQCRSSALKRFDPPAADVARPSRAHLYPFVFFRNASYLHCLLRHTVGLLTPFGQPLHREEPSRECEQERL
jgi:hypothetical protein